MSEPQEQQAQDPAQPAAPSAPTAGSESAPAAQPDSRPAPAFGEYAPEGWEWKPPTADNGESARADTPAARANPATANSGDQGRSGAPIAGVPHNLGSPGQTPAPKQQPMRPDSSQPVKPSQPNSNQQLQQQGNNAEPQPYRAATAPSQPKPRMADRVFTILLLALGAYGALSTAQSLLSLRASMMLTADALGIESYSPPAWLETVGTIGAVVSIAVYAFVLIASIRRMRAGKLTFWVPLVAGAVVTIALIVVSVVMILASPELMTAVQDPDATQRMLDYFSNPANTQ